MSIHFDPNGGLTIDLSAVLQAIREENHLAVSRKAVAYTAYRELSQLRNRMDGKLRFASKKCPLAFEEWIQGYVQFDTTILHKIIGHPHMYKRGLTNSTRIAIQAFVGNVERVQANYHSGNINMEQWNRLAQCRKRTGNLLTQAIRKSKKASNKPFWVL
jgi:macrodomain Ter protein organizer (MatP/YcbG family)